MKRFVILISFLYYLPVFADNTDRSEGNESSSDIQISIVNEVPATPVRDQHETSTCWSFSGISLLESELLRMGREEIDLSEMFIVRYNYERKAERYIRMHGKINFAPGGEANDVTDVIGQFGIIPESVYSGKALNTENHVHTEMDGLLEECVEEVLSNPDEKESKLWKADFDGVLDKYLGKLPESFDYEGKKYTAESFAEYLGINPDDYVMVTSFTHQPFYKSFILEVPDNWSWGASYNVPIDELEEIVDSAILKGYSLAWAADVSEDGFNFKRGIAVAPSVVYDHRSERKAEQWNKKTAEEKEDLIFNSFTTLEEIDANQQIRQEAFDNFTTTDDHGMHIVGEAVDASGKEYYYVKNSWGSNNPFGGYMFVSKAYFRYKTISVMLHRDAIPKEVAAKLGL